MAKFKFDKTSATFSEAEARQHHYTNTKQRTWLLLYAVYPNRGYFDLSPAGSIQVLDNGATVFTPDKTIKAKHRFLVMSDKRTKKVREAIVQLCVEPPAKISRQN